VIAKSDVLEFLDNLPKGVAKLIVTSPPYNMGKAYERRVGFEEYLRWQEEVAKGCVAALHPRGSLCWEVGNYVHKGEVFPLDIPFYEIFKKQRLKLRNRIVWHFGHGLHAKRRLSGRYETILWFTKGDDYTFNLDPVRVRQKYPGKRYYKGPNKDKPSGNRRGGNPSDFLTTVEQDWEREIWDIPNVKANHPEKTIHPSQFPVELVQRLILALTNPRDTVLDPFVGVGTSLIAAVISERKGIGVDKEKRYTDLAYSRVIKAMKGRLSIRPLGRPIYEPRGTERVSRVPPEWKEERERS